MKPAFAAEMQGYVLVGTTMCITGCRVVQGTAGTRTMHALQHHTCGAGSGTDAPSAALLWAWSLHNTANVQGWGFVCAKAENRSVLC
jgi:hypothetical protein